MIALSLSDPVDAVDFLIVPGYLVHAPVANGNDCLVPPAQEVERTKRALRVALCSTLALVPALVQQGRRLRRLRVKRRYPVVVVDWSCHVSERSHLVSTYLWEADGAGAGAGAGAGCIPSSAMMEAGKAVGVPVDAGGGVAVGVVEEVVVGTACRTRVFNDKRKKKKKSLSVGCFREMDTLRSHDRISVDCLAGASTWASRGTLNGPMLDDKKRYSPWEA